MKADSKEESDRINLALADLNKKREAAKMKHSEKPKSSEVLVAKKEFLEEIKPVSNYKWEDETGYELDDPKHPNYFDSIVDLYDVYGRDF